MPLELYAQEEEERVVILVFVEEEMADVGTEIPLLF